MNPAVPTFVCSAEAMLPTAVPEVQFADVLCVVDSLLPLSLYMRTFT